MVERKKLDNVVALHEMDAGALAFPDESFEGEVIGVIQVLNKHQGTFGDEDIDLLQALSMSGGSLMIFLQRGLTLALLVAAPPAAGAPRASSPPGPGTWTSGSWVRTA